MKGRLYYKGRIVVPSDSPKIPVILKKFHDSAVGGHAENFIAVLLGGDEAYVQQHVQGCEVCQRNKYQALNPAGFLQPLPIPSQVWSHISMDFIGGLPKALGKDTILGVVDR